MNIDKKVLNLLIGIFIIGLILRVVLLDKFPVALTLDEVGIGYNAYSILKTGKDEWGKIFPIGFRSVGDYKSPLLIYLVIPATAIFGLSEFSTRITIAIISSLSILIVYYIALKLLGKKIVALIAALLVAISPWHINPSRISHDAILGSFLILLGVVFFLKSKGENFKRLWISAVFFGLSLYAYHAQKIFVPIFIFCLFLIYFKELILRKRQLFFSIITGILITIPAILFSFSEQGQTRANMTFISKDFEINRFLHKDNKISLIQDLFDNNFLILFNFWTKRYLDYFSFNYFFVDGLKLSIPKSPDIGLLYLFELPFFMIGIYFLTFKKIVNTQTRLVIFSWFLIGSVAASLANNAQHIFRNISLIPILQLFSALGIWIVYRRIKFKKVYILSLTTIVFFNLAYFVNLYFVNYQYLHSENLMEGWKEATKFALENKKNYIEVIIDPRFGTMGPDIVGVPYLYVLFYGKIDPILYQNDLRRKERYDSANFQNFTFREIDWAEGEKSDKHKGGVLFIGSPWVLPVKDDQILKKFYLKNGKEILYAATVK